MSNLGWKQVLAGSITNPNDLHKHLNNVKQVPDNFTDTLGMRITPYLLDLMDKDDPNCPIRLQYVPDPDEMTVAIHEMGDQLGEDHDMPEGTSLVHRYPNRVLFLVHNICGSYCRHCTRKRMVSDPTAHVNKQRIRASIEYIGAHPEVEDVLLSGGDPLLFTDDFLDWVLSEIRRVRPDLKILRIGTRLPVQLPHRLDDNLAEILWKNQVTHLNVQVNHPKEITPFFRSQVRNFLRKSGVLLGNQTVLLKGVNDSVEVMRELCMELASMSIRPYYVYSMDPAPGNYHLQISYPRILELVQGLRGWISGVAIPTFVVDGIGGLGKMPVQPQYGTITEDEFGVRKLSFTNFEGKTHDHSFLLKEKDE